MSAVSCDRLHVTQIYPKQVDAWEQGRGPIRPAIRSELIALACAGKACGLSRFGYPICARPHLWKKPTGNHSLSPGVLTPGRIRILSMRSPTGSERETGRDLDCCWWQELRRKAPPSGDPPRRPFRPDGFCYGVCVHDGSNRCSSFSAPHQVQRDQWIARRLSLDGR
jgi:hypothetical protein